MSSYETEAKFVAAKVIQLYTQGQSASIERLIRDEAGPGDTVGGNSLIADGLLLLSVAQVELISRTTGRSSESILSELSITGERLPGGHTASVEPIHNQMRTVMAGEWSAPSYWIDVPSAQASTFLVAYSLAAETGARTSTTLSQWAQAALDELQRKR